MSRAKEEANLFDAFSISHFDGIVVCIYTSFYFINIIRLNENANKVTRNETPKKKQTPNEEREKRQQTQCI